MEEDFMYLCPECSKSNDDHSPPKGVLITRYQCIDENSGKTDFNSLQESKYLPLLPVINQKSFGPLSVGNTPMVELSYPNGSRQNFNCYAKVESGNPSFSFKDRASVLVSAYAKEKNIDVIVAASTGNAGSSLAGICASNHQKAIIFVPSNAPLGKLTQIVMYGATIIPVQGNYDQAYELSLSATEKFGLFNRNTAFNPFTIEGKKTVSFEIFAQLGMRVPDKIFVPVGDGVIISGIYKGFEDLLHLGIISKMPTLVAVQSEKSKNLIANLHTEKFIIYPSQTIADSISVDIPRNFYMTRNFLHKYEGKTLLVTDEEILKASAVCSRNSGLFVEPAAATAYAGMLKFVEDQQIASGENVVVLLSGNGLKDLVSVQPLLRIPEAISPNIELTKEILKI